MSDISSLGYVRVRGTDLDAWRRFAFEVIGFAEGNGPEDALYLRMDERVGRIVVLPGDNDRIDAVGWEVRDHLALRRVQAAAEAAGIVTKPLSQEEADARRVEAGLSFEAPGGTPTEVFHGPALDHSPIATPYGNGFDTGKLGAGHIVVPVNDVDASYRFYAETLGFLPRGSLRLPTPRKLGPVRLRFLGVNARHHSLAILPSPDLKAPALVHIMVECETLDDVGRALDRVVDVRLHLSSTLGRHTNDKMVSFYVRTPGGCTSRSDATASWSTKSLIPLRRSLQTVTGVITGIGPETVRRDSRCGTLRARNRVQKSCPLVARIEPPSSTLSTVTRPIGINNRGARL